MKSNSQRILNVKCLFQKFTFDINLRTTVKKHNLHTYSQANKGNCEASNSYLLPPERAVGRRAVAPAVYKSPLRAM